MNIQQLFPTDENIEINGIQTDSRLVQTGDLFVCIKGYTVDGHTFAKQAEKAGAVAIVCEHNVEDVTIPQIVVASTEEELPRLAHAILGEPSKKLNLFGVTGTNGKTTVACIVEHLLNGFEGHTGYIGTNGIRYGERDIVQKNTTPDALNLQKTFAEMVKNDVKNVSMEVSSHALALHRVDYCSFQAAIFTNLTPEHLDFHVTMENYFEEKYKLFTKVTPTGAVITNIDDEYGERIAQRMTENGTRCYTYSLEKTADFQAVDLEMSASGTSFTLLSPEGKHKVDLPFVGTFNVYNLLGALGAVYSVGMDLEKAVQLVATLEAIPGRMEIIDEGQDFLVIVDFAHTPDGLEKLLEFVQTIKQQSVIVVIGCSGDRDTSNRPVMAKLCVDRADYAIFTTEDPHSEDPVAILDEMVVGLEDENYEVIVDRTEAIERAVNIAKSGDMVLVLGRGHYALQYWSSGDIELDDREVAREMLRKAKVLS